VGEGSAEFAEGGADTSTYAHYAIANGGERTHRRFDASTGPALIGKGTRLTVRATSYEMGDVRFLLHTPDLYNEGYSDFVNQLSRSIPPDVLPASVTSAGLASMNVLDYDKAC